MNKIGMLTVAGVGLAMILLLSSNSIQNNSAELEPLHESQHNHNSTDGHSTGQENNGHLKVDTQQAGLEKSHHQSEAGFNFTPYISKDMADEIRPYTSRSKEGLEVKIDSDGHEYVDLKKRWSHATVSVIDENGVKHTGEWAPE